LLVKIQNQNTKNWAYFDIVFYNNNGDLAREKSFILPEEEKYATSLSLENVRPGDAVGARIENIVWQRINSHEISNWTNFKDSHLNLKIENIQVINGVKEKGEFDNLDFDIINNTAYNYWSIDFVIILSNGLNNNLAVSKYAVEKVRSGEKKHVSIAWPGLMSGSFAIFPEINIMNKGVYMDF